MTVQSLRFVAVFAYLATAVYGAVVDANGDIDLEDLEAAISYEIDVAQRQLERKKKLLAETETLLDSDAEYYISNAYKG